MTIQKNYFLTIWRPIVLILWMSVLPILFLVGRAINWPRHRNLPHIFHKGIRKILGLNVTFSGELSDIKPTLYASNHISYLDIFVLGNIRAFYIAKSEVASWPILGKLAKYQNTLFIERKAGKARHQIKIMQTHLEDCNSLILFAEGTSTDGVHVESFKSSLFEAANIDREDVKVAIQPITVAYTHQAGNKMNQTMRDHYAWYGSMPFGSHFAKLFPLKKVEVKVHFHPVCYLDEFETRKQCADYCQQMVSQQLEKFIV